jgi:hypothetical protein
MKFSSRRDHHREVIMNAPDSKSPQSSKGPQLVVLTTDEMIWVSGGGSNVSHGNPGGGPASYNVHSSPAGAGPAWYNLS